MFLLDTNVVSELRRPRRADPNVLAFAESHSSTRFWLSSVTVLELEMGMLKMARRDPDQGRRLERWIDERLAEFGPRILPIDADIARRCAKLHVPDPRPDRDAYIAATALVHGMTVVTRNIRDFEPTGVPLLDPWRPAA